MWIAQPDRESLASSLQRPLAQRTTRVLHLSRLPDYEGVEYGRLWIFMSSCRCTPCKTASTVARVLSLSSESRRSRWKRCSFHRPIVCNRGVLCAVDPGRPARIDTPPRGKGLLQRSQTYPRYHLLSTQARPLRYIILPGFNTPFICTYAKAGGAWFITL